MILNDSYILVNEIAKNHNISISNFSPLSTDDSLIESKSIIKKSGTTVINRDSVFLPKYIKKLANEGEYTNLDGLIMMSCLKDDYYIEEKYVSKIGKMIEIEGKKFVKLNEDLMHIFSNEKLVIYPIHLDEIEEDYMKEIIEKKQFKQIDKKMFLTWY